MGQARRPQRPKRFKGYAGAGPEIYVPRLGEAGLAVFRTVAPNQVDRALQVVAERLGGLIISHRGELGKEKPPAVSLVEGVETLRQKALGGVAVREATDAVFRSIDSLRRKTTVRPQGLRIFGRFNSIQKVLGVDFDAESAARLRQERDEILEVLESLSSVPANFDWLPHKRPNVPLARFSYSQISNISPSAIQAIEEVLPEEIELEKATFHRTYRLPKPG